MVFEWDEGKRRQNIAKHGIDFAIAVRIFNGFTLSRVDSRYDYGEIRRVTIGMTDALTVVVVIHTDRNGLTRLISARPASRRERSNYELRLRQGQSLRKAADDQ